jgi:hypothetical protein
MERAAGVGREASDVSSSGELSPQEKRDIIEAELARTEVRLGGHGVVEAHCGGRRSVSRGGGS